MYSDTYLRAESQNALSVLSATSPPLQPRSASKHIDYFACSVVLCMNYNSYTEILNNITHQVGYDMYIMPSDVAIE